MASESVIAGVSIKDILATVAAATKEERAELAQLLLELAGLGLGILGDRIDRRRGAGGRGVAGGERGSQGGGEEGGDEEMAHGGS